MAIYVDAPVRILHLRRDFLTSLSWKLTTLASELCVFLSLSDSPGPRRIGVMNPLLNGESPSISMHLRKLPLFSSDSSSSGGATAGRSSAGCALAAADATTATSASVAESTASWASTTEHWWTWKRLAAPAFCRACCSARAVSHAGAARAHPTCAGSGSSCAFERRAERSEFEASSSDFCASSRRANQRCAWFVVSVGVELL